MPAPIKSPQITESVRDAFRAELGSSRMFFFVFSGLSLLFVTLEALHAFDAFGIKKHDAEFGAAMDFIFITSILLCFFLAFGRYARAKCPGCKNGLWTMDNPQYCPKCFQPFTKTGAPPA